MGMAANNAAIGGMSVDPFLRAAILLGGGIGAPAPQALLGRFAEGGQVTAGFTPFTTRGGTVIDSQQKADLFAQARAATQVNTPTSIVNGEMMGGTPADDLTAAEAYYQNLLAGIQQAGDQRQQQNTAYQYGAAGLGTPSSVVMPEGPEQDTVQGALPPGVQVDLSPLGRLERRRKRGASALPAINRPVDPIARMAMAAA